MRHDYQYIFDEFFSIHDESVRAALVADYEAYVARCGGNPTSFHRWLGNRVEQYGEGAALVLVAENAALRERLAALVGDADAGLFGRASGCKTNYFCAHCDAHSRYEWAQFQHAPDCPIVRARAVLARAE